MKYILFSILFLFGVMSVHSQHTFSKLLDYDSTHRQQVLNVQFIDSIYYLTSAKLGYTGIQNFYSDYAKFLKIDYDGNIMDSSEDTTITYLQETTVVDSSHVYIFGFSRPYIDSLFNISVRSLATNETTVKVYSNLADGIYRYSPRHAILYGKNIILAGPCKDKFDQDRVKSFLISIDKNTLEVNKVIIYDKGSSWNSFNNVFVTKDGNLAVFSEYENEGTNNAEYRGLVIYDRNLHELDSWYKGGYNPYRDNFKCYLTKEDIFILAQYPQKYKSEQTIMAFDLSGNKLWEFTLNWFETMEIYAIKESKSNDILIAGEYDRNLIDGLPRVGFVAKISKAGKLIWFRSISDFSGGFDSGSFQYANPAVIFDFTEEDNMKITLFGYLGDNYFDVASGFIKPNSNIWMVRLDEHGCLDQDRCNYDIVLNPVNNWYIYDQINVLQKEWRYRIKDKYGHVKWTVQKFEGDTMIFDPAFDWRKYHQWVTTTSDGADTSTDTIKFRWTKEGKLNFIKPWKGFTVYPDSTMYDFALRQGDVFTLPHGFGTATVIIVDSIPLSDGKLRKRLILRHDNTDNHKKFGLLTWIEGIGSPNGLLYYYDWINETQTDLLCYFDRGQRRYGIADESCTILSSIENPTIDPANKWIVDYSEDIISFKEIRVYNFSNKDTLLNGKMYKEMVYSKLVNPEIYYSANEFYRQDGNKVWRYNGDYDILLADFGLNAGDTLVMENPQFVSKPLVIASRDTVVLADGKPRKRLRYYCGNEEGMPVPDENKWTSMTEGLGTEIFVFGQILTCSLWDPLWERVIRCFYENNTLVYKSDHVDDCLTTSADDSKIQNFRIYPNPTCDEIIIISEFDHGVLSVYHSNGQLILQKMITKTDKVDVSAFQSGLYLTQFKTPNGEIIRSKFVKM